MAINTQSTVLTVNAPENIVATFLPFVTTENWTQLGPQSGSPSARSFASAAYDPINNATLFFGGTNGTSVLSDTSLWSAMSGRRSLLAPRRRAFHGGDDLGYPNQYALLFGGNSNPTGDTPLGDTWITASTHTWTQLNPASKPGARESASITFDSLHTQDVLFGGGRRDQRACRYLGLERHHLDQCHSASNNPHARSSAAMAFDSVHNQVVMFGGVYSGDYINDTWIWGGGG